MGEVPVLEVTVSAGSRQSGAILMHLAAKHGRFGGESEEDRSEVLRWILFDNHKFIELFRHLSLHEVVRADRLPDPAVMVFLQGRIEGAYGVVDKHLAEREFLAGSQPTIADFSLSGYVFYPESESGLDLQSRFRSVAAWVERLKRVPAGAIRTTFCRAPGSRRSGELPPLVGAFDVRDRIEPLRDARDAGALEHAQHGVQVLVDVAALVERRVLRVADDAADLHAAERARDRRASRGRCRAAAARARASLGRAP